MDYDYKKLSKSDLANYHKKMPLAAETQRIVMVLQELSDDEMGCFTAKGDTKTGTLKMRILRAAKVLNKKVVVKRYGNDVVFWIEPETKIGNSSNLISKKKTGKK